MREIVLFSLPSIAASLLEPLSAIVDTGLVGQLDTEMLAALAVGTTLLSTFTWVFNFLIHASTQALAGASDDNLGGRTRVSLTIALVVGVVTAVFLYAFRVPLYQLVSDKILSVDLVDEYFVPRLIGHPLAILFMTSLSLLRGLSRVQLALIFVAVSTGCNIFSSWFFLYILKIGLAGAAWGTVFANGIGMLACFIALSRDERVRQSFSKLPALTEWFSFGKNSLNLFGRSLALTGSLFLGARFAAADGAEALAAHQILLQVWLFVSFFIDGVAITANIKGSELARDQQRESFRALVKQVLLLGLCLGAFFSVYYFIFDDLTQGIFTRDPVVLELIDDLWPWIAITQIPNALAFVYDGVLFGLGSIGGFVWVRRWMIVGSLLVFLPISLTISGLKGVWFAFIALNCFRLLTGWWTTNHLLKKISS